MISSFSFNFSLVYAQLTNFAKFSNFWSLFDTAFGSSYDFAKAAEFKSQWQSGNFSQFPQIEIVSNDVLGRANGAYAISTNKIYLSDAFISSASQQSLEAVILEEMGHFVDAQVNGTDTAGDEGELFSDLVRGVSLSAAELSRIKTEDDHAVMMIDGQAVAIEKANGQVNLITNGSFEIGPNPESFLPLDPGSTAITGWTITRDQIDYKGSLWIDADGSRSIDLNGTPGVGGIAQTFNTIAGQQYLVSFALAGNPAGGTPIKQLEVSAAGQSEAFSFDTTGFSYNNMGWVNKTWVFTAIASTTTLEFYSLSIEPENALFGHTLDNVCVISLLPSITLAVAPASVTEDSTTNLVYTFTRTGTTTNALTVNYSIAGTADATDYTGATPGTGKTITFEVGSPIATLMIDPTADAIIEADETVTLTLATGIGYTIGTTSAETGTILNDDYPLKQWTKLLGTSSDASASALTTGNDGAIYVSGNTDGNLDGQTNSGGVDTFITKYNPDGTKLWTRLLGTGSYDYSTALTTGNDGAIYVSGYTEGNLDGQTYSGGDYDAFITKYNPDGTKVWTKLLGTNGDDDANALTTGNDAAIYISGWTKGNLDGQTNSGGYDAFITKYNPDGTKVWTKLLGTSSGENAYALTTGNDGAILSTVIDCEFQKKEII